MQLISTKHATQNGIKCLVYGESGAGKTRLCASTGGTPLIISAEAGLLSLRDYDLASIPVKTVAELEEALKFCQESDDAKQFDWICLDSISEIAEVILNYEKKQTRDPRQAYGALSEQMQDIIRAFRDLPDKNVYFSCKMERIKDAEGNLAGFGPSMPGSKLAQSLPYFFDEVFALHLGKDETENSVRWLQTESDYKYIAKDRSGSLEPQEPANLSVIANKIAAKTNKTQKQEEE